MKSATTILATIAFTMLFSQDYIPFPESNTTWRDGNFSTMIWPPADTFYMYFKTAGDTVINGMTYTVIDHNETPDFCFIRQNQGKVFCRCNAWTSDTTEFVLYDFTLEAGDEIELYMFPGMYYSGGVSWVDSVLVGNQYRKRIVISSWIEITFIEGIGSAQGFFYPYIPWVDTDGILDCISINDTIYSITGTGTMETGNCWPTTGFENISTRLLVIYPNPSHNIIRVSPEGDYFLELYDTEGSSVLTAASSTLSIRGLPEGLYYLKVHDQRKKLLTTGKVLKINR